MSETERQETEFEDDVSTTSTHGSESPMTSDNETETQEDKDPWMPMVEEAMQNHRATFEEIKLNLIHSGLTSNRLSKMLTQIFYLRFKRNWRVSIWSVSYGCNS